MVRRIFYALLTALLLLLAACTPPSPPEDWQEIINSYQEDWEALLGQSEVGSTPLRLNVSVEVVSRGGEPRPPIEAPEFSAAGTQVAYWRNPDAATDDAPDGAILVPGSQDFAKVVDQQDGVPGERNIATLLALFYADHLINEVSRVGLANAEEFDETARLCLAGVTLREHMGITLLGNAEGSVDNFAMTLDLVADHRPAAQSVANKNGADAIHDSFLSPENWRQCLGW